jgi:hypothetical protein
MFKRPTLAHRERRAAMRWPSRTKMPCRLKRVTEEGAWLASVRDISLDGIGLTVNRAFKPGMSLTLELPIQPNLCKQILVHVRHARRLGGNGNGPIWWAVGGVFARKLTREEIEFLRNRAPAILYQSERRTSIRHTTRLKSPCPVIRVSEEGPWLTTIRNVSEHGLGLISNRPFKPGTLLTVELPDKLGRLGKPRLFRLVHMRQQQGASWWILGGALLSKLLPQEIHQLR